MARTVKIASDDLRSAFACAIHAHSTARGADAPPVVAEMLNLRFDYRGHNSARISLQSCGIQAHPPDKC